MPRLRRTLAVSARALAVLVGFSLLAETALRFQKYGAAGLSPWEMSTMQPILQSEFAMALPQGTKRRPGSWGFLPNTVGWNKGERFEVNNQGIRGRDVQRRKPEGVLRVAIVGGSMTMAGGVPLDETYPVVLEGLLNESGDSEGRWEVLNMGIPFTRDALNWHFQRTLYLEPDMILWQIGRGDQDRRMARWLGAESKRKTYEGNLEFAPKFALKRSIPIFGFALSDDEHVLIENEFFTLLQPLGVDYGSDRYIYPTDDHPDPGIHAMYAARLFERIDERRGELLGVIAENTPDYGTSYKPLPDPRPLSDVANPFWRSQLWRRMRASFLETRERVVAMGESLPWSERGSG